MKPTDTPISDFLASLPDGVREDLTDLDADLAAVFEGHERALWVGPMWGGTEQRIIGYGRFRQQNRSGDEVDWFVVGLAAQKAHLSLYVSAVEDGRYLVQRWADRLGRVKVGSANVTFRRLDDLDRGAVVAMAERARDLMLPG
ncbi:MAG TPA: DUF1801 domain-containing protein [Candidatus Angelobacter sp.]|nr:DUF1801 domain-containing protein [Candidatus Angelobacter sp.]